MHRSTLKKKAQGYTNLLKCWWLLRGLHVIKVLDVIKLDLNDQGKNPI